MPPPVNHRRLETAYRVLDTYVSHLKGRPPGSTQAMAWEWEAVAQPGCAPEPLAKPNSQYRVLILARAKGLGVITTLFKTEDGDGFIMSLPRHDLP